jgi:vancomycin resistance protein VanJ
MTFNSLAEMQPPHRKKRLYLLLGLNVLYTLVLLTLLLSNLIGPEKWWLGSFNLYLPQWLWAIPGVILLPLTLGLARKWVWLPLAALLCVFGPIMGLCGNRLLGGAAPTRGAQHLRIMTYNVKWGSRDTAAILRDIQTYNPDILQLQDSSGAMRGGLGPVLAEWNVRIHDQYIVASRLPLPDFELRDISYPGSVHHCVRIVIPFGSGSVVLYNAHLLSPRVGLISIRHRREGGLVSNTDSRLLEANLLAGYIKNEHGPTLLTGDLNAPVQSLVCRPLFDAGLRDAFSEAGTGYGYTYGKYTRVGYPYVRIDHILVSREWKVQHCWVGNSTGSDHCPVIADLALP